MMGKVNCTVRGEEWGFPLGDSDLPEVPWPPRPRCVDSKIGTTSTPLKWCSVYGYIGVAGHDSAFEVIDYTTETTRAWQVSGYTDRLVGAAVVDENNIILADTEKLYKVSLTAGGTDLRTEEREVRDNNDITFSVSRTLLEIRNVHGLDYCVSTKENTGVQYAGVFVASENAIYHFYEGLSNAETGVWSRIGQDGFVVCGQDPDGDYAVMNKVSSNAFYSDYDDREFVFAGKGNEALKYGDVIGFDGNRFYTDNSLGYLFKTTGGDRFIADVDDNWLTVLSGAWYKRFIFPDATPLENAWFCQSSDFLMLLFPAMTMVIFSSNVQECGGSSSVPLTKVSGSAVMSGEFSFDSMPTYLGSTDCPSSPWVSATGTWAFTEVT